MYVLDWQWQTNFTDSTTVFLRLFYSVFYFSFYNLAFYFIVAYSTKLAFVSF